jgi:hypothetical protein
MTERYDAWLAAIALRDQTYAGLALIALLIVVVWELSRYIHPAWLSVWVRRIYLVAGPLLFVAGLAASYLALEAR